MMFDETVVPEPVCTQSDFDHVERIVVKSGTSFGQGMRILAPARRNAMFAIYAFCREVDDIADGDTGVADPKQALQDWHGRIKRLYAGETQNALDRALLAAIRRFDLREEDFHAVIDGMAMDCDGPIVAPDEKTLDLYCDRVASAVGRLSILVFGAPQESGRLVAHHLGRALQLTNILRDLSEDAQRGRLYLPRELLERFNVSASPDEALYAHGLDELCRILAARAHDHFREAKRAMADCPPRAMRPAYAMAASYHVVLRALERRGWRNPDHPPKICGMCKKLRVLLACVR